MKRAIGLCCAVICGWLSQAGCSDNLCANELFQTINSPDNSLKVVVFDRDCGATTGFSRQVAILKQGEKFPKKANVLPIVVIDGQHKIEVKWMDSKSMRIRYQSGNEIINQNLDRTTIRVDLESYDWTTNGISSTNQPGR